MIAQAENSSQSNGTARRARRRIETGEAGIDPRPPCAFAMLDALRQREAFDNA